MVWTPRSSCERDSPSSDNSLWFLYTGTWTTSKWSLRLKSTIGELQWILVLNDSLFKTFCSRYPEQRIFFIWFKGKLNNCYRYVYFFHGTIENVEKLIQRLTVFILIDSVLDLRVTKRVTDVQIADESSLAETQQHCSDLDIVWPCCLWSMPSSQHLTLVSWHPLTIQYISSAQKIQNSNKNIS